MFYGSLKESGDPIIVEDTTIIAFEKLVEYVYQVDIDCKEIAVRELFDLVNLAERYEIDKLKEELSFQMEIVPLTMSNLMEVSSIGCKFSNFFDSSIPMISGLVARNCPSLIKVVPIDCKEFDNLSPSSRAVFKFLFSVKEKDKILNKIFIVNGGS